MMILDFITWNVDPVIFNLGPLSVRWYGLCWAIGIYLCYLVQVQLYKHENCPADWADKIFIWMALGVIIGARIGHCWFYEWYDVTNPAYANFCRLVNISTDPVQIFGWTINYRNPYIEHPLQLIKIWEGGLSSHGGGIGLFIAAWLLNRKHFSKQPQFHTSMIWILDRLCLGVCITATLIRFGNLMNSEIYGGPTDMPWGFIFVRDGQTVPCHPTQIYEMLYCLVALPVTWLMYWKGKAYRREGLLIGTFLLIVFVTRFALEFIKLDQSDFEAGHILNMGQWLSLPFIAIAVYLILRAFRRPLNPDTAVELSKETAQSVIDASAKTNEKRKSRR
ncbi:MAG: prolipoprotein diacylglyceryl transferase [Paludibacteraceae bacterium]|nr:prolipoprotein diacylglyceryl transferase [Paludibacteraceae bacterium]